MTVVEAIDDAEDENVSEAQLLHIIAATKAMELKHDFAALTDRYCTQLDEIIAEHTPKEPTP